MPTMPLSPAAPLPKTVAIVGKYQAVGMSGSLLDIAEFLKAAGREVLFESETARGMQITGYGSLSIADIGRHAGVVIVVGGDGTMLGIARQLAPFGIPLIGVNQGRLGFMTDISLDEAIGVLGEMLEGKFSSERRSLLEGDVVRDGQVIFRSVAFNDIVVSRSAASGMVELRVEVDGHFMYNQRSDGLIISTPTGSTAYALSAGGPILHPTLGGIALVPIAPHALSNRPIVVPDSVEIVVEVRGGRENSVNFDMQSLEHLHHCDRVVIRRAADTVTFLHPQGWSYYDTLREKLHWNEYPSVEGQLK